ncbi:MAG: hypothetical protein LCH88_22190 [Proteobacteria bacterium]|nr:hypothetical protein [Pseudomonadota bacterium]
MEPASAIDWDAFGGWAMTAALLIAVIGVVWFVRWRRDPKGFAETWRRGPANGSHASHGTGGKGPGGGRP